MEEFTFEELCSLSFQERNDLKCVKVTDKTRNDLLPFIHSLNARYCSHSRCTTLLFPLYNRTRCIKCKPPTQTPHNTMQHRKLDEQFIEHNRVQNNIIAETHAQEQRTLQRFLRQYPITIGDTRGIFRRMYDAVVGSIPRAMPPIPGSFIPDPFTSNGTTLMPHQQQQPQNGTDNSQIINNEDTDDIPFFQIHKVVTSPVDSNSPIPYHNPKIPCHTLILGKTGFFLLSIFLSLF